MAFFVRDTALAAEVTFCGSKRVSLLTQHYKVRCPIEPQWMIPMTQDTRLGILSHRKPRFNGDDRPTRYTSRMERAKVRSTRTTERLALVDSKLLVRFTRTLEEGSVTGYILATGPQFFLLALVDEYVRFNGFQCFRLKDVRNLQAPAKYAVFIEAALKLRGQRKPRKPRISVQSIQELLRTAGRLFPIVTIHQERVDPDVCHIGSVMSVSESEVSLLEIGPDARWEKKALSYRIAQITRVDFGGDYEQALTLVGGHTPAPEGRKP